MKKKALLIPLVIAIVGTAVWSFMLTLAFVIDFFQIHWMYLVALLPIVCVVHGYLDHLQNMHRLGNTETLITEIRNPQKHVHWLLAPWIYLMTVIFHLFGASVGRESTAVQMGGSLAESLGRLIRIPVEDRPILIRMGLACGFGAAFGVPWSGAVFALESPWLYRKRDWYHLPFFILCSWGGDQWAFLLGLRHQVWNPVIFSFAEIAGFSFLFLSLGLVFLALGYELIYKNTNQQLKKIPWWLRAVLGGLFILLLTLSVGAPKFNNLGTSLIAASFHEAASFYQAGMKLLFTWISTTTGMKGGEVTPLMSAGALFGSWLANRLKIVSFQLGSALGLVTLFTSRLRIPVTGLFMLWEFFDWKIALLGAPTLLLIEFGHRKLVSKLS